MQQAIVIMGVCGTGKTTVGETLAMQLGCPFLEGDSFHPPENVAKMSAGTPLDDEDRWPWLDRLGRQMAEERQDADHVIAACSALKRAYRDRIRRFTGEDTLFVLLHGARDLLQQRLLDRSNHYMPASLLDSQLAILEPPSIDELSLSLDVEATCSELVSQIETSIASAKLSRRPGLSEEPGASMPGDGFARRNPDIVMPGDVLQKGLESPDAPGTADDAEM